MHVVEQQIGRGVEAGRLRAPSGVRLIELLSLCGWHVDIVRHPAGGLRAVATRGELTVEVAGGLVELPGLLFLKCMRESQAQQLIESALSR